MTVTAPAVVSFAASATPVTCFAGNDGTITVTSAAGGNGVYQYSKDNGTSYQPGNVFTGLSAGDYQVMVKDGNSCLSAAQTVTVTAPAVVSFAASATPVTCFAGNDGTITVTSAAGGNGVYQYSKDNGTSYQPGNVFTGLSAGDYQVMVKDGNSCLSAAQTVTVTAPAVVSFAASATPVTCFAGNDGTITVTSAAGGNGVYQYSKDNGTSYQPGNVFTGLSAGDYQVMVKDGNSCLSAAQTVTVTAPAVVSFAANATPVTCFAGNDGTITVTSAAGGNGVYQYSKDNGTSYQPGNVFTGLSAGDYQVMVKDGNSCLSAAQTVTVTAPAVVNFAASATPVTCFAGNDGTITVTSAAGGNGVYQYSKDNGTSYQPGNVFTGLSAGDYQVMVKDGNSCLSAAQTVTVTAPAVVSFAASATPVTCFAGNDGTITVTSAAGGNGVYQYSKDNGTSYQPGNVFTGLSAGDYQVMVKDGNSCLSAAQTVTVTAPAVVSFAASATPVTCFAGNDGTITVTSAAGGNGVYQYSKDNGTSYQPGNVFTGLSAGDYQVMVKDGNSCLSAAQTVTVTAPAVVSFAASATPVTCFAGNDGTITVTSAAGGNGVYQYSKDNGTSYQPGNVFTGLSAGDYQVMVKDGNSCLSAAQTVTVTAPAVVSFAASATPVTCFAGNDGTITVTSAAGGNGVYQYSKDNGTSYQPGNVFTGLSAGDYQVMVKDGNSCLSAAQTVTVTAPAVVSFAASATPVTCFAGNDGTITVTSAAGGNGVYQYSKDNGTSYQPGNVFTGLSAGDYQVMVKDGNSCLSAAQTVTVTAPAVVSFAASATPVTCFAGNDGTITVTSAAGGNGVYQYSKDNGTSYQPGNVFTGLSAGDYQVMVKDGNSCLSAAQTVTVTAPAVVSFAASATPVTCFAGNDGTITVTSAAGGNGVYQYSKDNGTSYQPGNVFTGLSAGDYQVMVKDGNSCLSAAQTVTVTAPAVVNFAASATPVTCFAGNDGTITVTSAAGGNGVYQYSKDNGTSYQPGNVFTGLSAGDYQVMVKDGNSCLSAAQTVTVTAPAVVSFAASATPVTCFAGNDGTITVTSAAGGNGVYQYSKDNGTSYQPGNVFTGLSAGDYQVMVKDGNSCLSAAQTVTGPRRQW